MDTQPSISKGQEKIKKLHYELGKDELKKGNLDEAIEQFEELLGRDPNYKDAQSLLRQARFRKTFFRYRWIFIGAGVVIVLLFLCGIISMAAGWFAISSDDTPTAVAIATDTSTAISSTPEPDTPPSPPPTEEPTREPTQEPTTEPTVEPTQESTTEPTQESGIEPTQESTIEPTLEPTVAPTQELNPNQLSGKIAVPVFENGIYNIYLASADNGWTPKLLFERASQPNFSNNGQGMVLRSWNKADWAQSFVYLPDYTNLAIARKMTDFIEDAHPALNSSNDIVFHTIREGNPIIVKIGTFPGAENDPDNNQIKFGEGENPDWLGKRIIFYAPYPEAGIYVMNEDGGGKTLILPTEGKVVPAASSDGDQVAVSLHRGNRWQIFTFSVSQGADSLTQLTSTSDADNYLPAWSPDGNYLAFASNREGNWALWVMQADGSQQRKLFNLPGSVDGTISVTDINPALSFGWWEERISWAR